MDKESIIVTVIVVIVGVMGIGFVGYCIGCSVYAPPPDEINMGRIVDSNELNMDCTNYPSRRPKDVILVRWAEWPRHTEEIRAWSDSNNVLCVSTTENEFWTFIYRYVADGRETDKVTVIFAEPNEE